MVDRHFTKKIKRSLYMAITCLCYTSLSTSVVLATPYPKARTEQMVKHYQYVKPKVESDYYTNPIPTRSFGNRASLRIRPQSSKIIMHPDMPRHDTSKAVRKTTTVYGTDIPVLFMETTPNIYASPEMLRSQPLPHGSTASEPSKSMMQISVRPSSEPNNKHDISDAELDAIELEMTTQNPAPIRLTEGTIPIPKPTMKKAKDTTHTALTLEDIASLPASTYLPVEESTLLTEEIEIVTETSPVEEFSLDDVLLEEGAVFEEIEIVTDTTPVEEIALEDIIEDTQQKTVDNTNSITYYDATQQGNTPTFMQEADALTMEQRGSVTQRHNISKESKTILSSLPKDIFPDERSLRSFEIERSDTTTDLPTGDEFASNPNVGANIAIKRQSMDVNYELEKAYNALLRGNTEIAIAIYKSILAVEQNNQHALFGLATTYHRLGLKDKARPVYGQLLSLDPYHKEALNNFLALVGEEAPDSAIAYLKQLKANNPTFSPIPAQLAQLYMKQGNTNMAISSMQEAVALSPENLIYTYNLAVLYDRSNQTDRAIPIYRRLVRAGLEGKEIPTPLNALQERLTFLASN